MFLRQMYYISYVPRLTIYRYAVHFVYLPLVYWVLICIFSAKVFVNHCPVVINVMDFLQINQIMIVNILRNRNRIHDRSSFFFFNFYNAMYHSLQYNRVKMITDYWRVLIIL